ncbi:MAG: GNAT family N-acetyltransferase, partial [Promethearchaeota archaeon]
MPKDFTIRLATIKDAKAVHEVLLAAFAEYTCFYSAEGFADTVLSEERAKDRIKEMKVYVAIDQHGKIIGTIGWQKLNENEGHIRGMGVIPIQQGKDSPAISLLRQVERDAQLEGCKILTLDTTEIL